MDKVLDTLFYCFTEGHENLPNGQIAFLGAQYHPFLDSRKSQFTLQQFFKPYAQDLENRNFKVEPEFLDNREFSTVFVLLPKNVIEAQYWIALALSCLGDNGILICAADNKAGGARIQKILQDFGLEDVQSISKNKAKAVWGVKKNVNNDLIKNALQNGRMQLVEDINFVSQPGIFGWDKIDKGSEILTKHLPKDFTGSGADFGCGYGFLSHHILSSTGVLKKLYCVDADYRAVQVSRENLKNSSCEIAFMWDDLTQPKNELKNLDWIVMNPPFHEGKKADFDIGVSFIKIACHSLRSSGNLWLVANAMLPYEDVLKMHFSSVEKKFEGSGFKVFCAVK